MSTLAALALVMENARQIVRQRASGRELLRLGAERLSGGLGTGPACCSSRLFVALLVTASRGGIFATLAGALVLLILYGLKPSRARLGGTGWTLVIIVGLVLVARGVRTRRACGSPTG